MLPRYKANSEKNNNAQARSQQSHFATLLKSHPRTDTPPKIRSTSAEHPPLGEHLWETLEGNFKRLKLCKNFIYRCDKKFINTKNG